jgi:putative ABC transport system permease protein
MKSILFWWKRLFRRESEWQEEIQSHLDLRRDWHQHGSGMSWEEADVQARQQFGSPLRVFEDIREIHTIHWLADLVQDASYAARTFRRSPAFVLTAVATMAVGIGAATAMFSIVDPLLFRPLPYWQDGRLVSIGIGGPIDTNEFLMGSMYLDWHERQTVFESMTSMRPASECDLTVTTPQRVHCIAVESNFLHTLGVKPVLGRTFSKEEDRPHAPPVVLLSYGLWQSRFGGQAEAINQVISLDGQQARVVGILPSDFVMPQRGEVDVLLPEQLDETVARAPNATVFLRCFARLKPGVSMIEAQTRMYSLFQAAVQTGVPQELRKEISFVIRSLRDRQIQEAKLASWMLLGAVSFLLLMACTNVSNLLLARSAARQNERAMRAALGAGRGRLLRQSLTESLLLGVFGGTAGCMMGYLFLRTLVAVAPGGFLRLDEAKLDSRVLFFSSLAALGSALLFGLLPALDRPGTEAFTGWRVTGSRRLATRHLLVITQIALSLVLLTGACLLIRSLRKLETQPIGFQPEHLIAASFVLNHHRYSDPQKLIAFYDALEARLSHVPGVSSFALSDSMPPAGNMHGRPLANMRVAGRPAFRRSEGMIGFRFVTPSYFQTFGIPFVAGRGFEEGERTSVASPLILSESLAKRMFGQENAVGQRIATDDNGAWHTVVGIVQDVKNSGLEAPALPEYYQLRPHRNDQVSYRTGQLSFSSIALFRTSLSPEALRHWVQQETAALDPTLPIQMISVPERVHHLNDRPRFLTSVVGIFATTGLLLAGVGLYGVMSFLVANRTKEIGVRTALGATRRDILLLIHKQAALWTALGIALGLLASLALARLVRGLLFQTSPYDLLSFSSAALLLALVGTLAAWWPSQSAAKVDPVLSLREE